jgi:hypothetical protein
LDQLQSIQLHVAGLAIQIAGPASLLELLHPLLGAMIVPATAKPPDVTLMIPPDGVGWWSIHEGFHQPMLLPGEVGAASALLPLWLTHIILAMQPELLLLHGNGLQHRESGHLLLLVGGSGVGKSTISRQMEHDWRVVAEDQLLLEPRRGVLWPYPRAAALKDEPAEVLPRRLAAGGRERWLAPAEPLTTHRPIPLGGACVVLLERPAAPPPESADPRYRLTLSALPSGLELALVEHAGVPPQAHLIREDCHLLEWERRPLIWDAERVAALAAEHGALVLHQGGQKPGAGNPSPTPVVTPMRPSDFLLRLLPHWRPGPNGSASKAMMGLGRLFASSHFATLVVGGTSSESAAAVETWMTGVFPI